MTTQISATQPDAHFHPEKRLVCETVLHEGTRVKKSVRLWDICDPKTGDHKKYSFTVEREHVSEGQQSISLEASEKEQSLTKLHRFLVGAPQIDTEGEYKVVDVERNPLGDLLDSNSTAVLDEDSVGKLVALLANSENVRQLAQLGSDLLEPTKSLAAALNLARMSQQLEEFKRLVYEGCGKCKGCKSENACIEKTFQVFLEENHWIFGSEYSELGKNRELTKGIEVDFPLRRTVDGYLEIIEIKRPKIGTSDEKLFRIIKDEKTEKEYVLCEMEPVVKAVAQVDDYLAHLDKNQRQVKEDYEIDAEKVRGIVIIGTLGGDKIQRAGLRRLNARLNRIEVITYDQLIARAERMLTILGEQRTIDDETEEYEQETAAVVSDAPDSFEDDGDDWNSPATVDDIPF